ncbi:MAG: hypothetical protein HY866_05005, partial [Chloroflexi bacterium]|nr:hypothetical protein [Chloroflexota bacterium]
TVVFENLTLAQALRYLIWRPAQTGRLFWRVLTHDPDEETPPIPTAAPAPETEAPEPAGEVAEAEGSEFVPESAATQVETRIEALTEEAPETAARSITDWLILAAAVLLGVIVILAVRGGTVLRDAAFDPIKRFSRDIDGAEKWFLWAGALWIMLELVQSRRWWAGKLPRLNRWLWARFHRNDLSLIWVAALVPLTLILLLIATFVDLPLYAAALLGLLAGVIWLEMVIGMTEPDKNQGAASSAPTTALFPQTEELRGTAPSPTLLERGSRGEAVLSESQANKAGGSQSATITAPKSSGGWLDAYRYHLLLIPLALLLSAWTYRLNVARDSADHVVDVVITPSGAWAWLLSIGLWLLILGADVRRLPERLKVLAFTEVKWGWVRRVRLSWPVIALLGVTALGAYFRLHNLDASPPEMTSDHIEKLLDAIRVSEGYHAVFFANNGGREAFQMYLVAFIAEVFGVGFTFDALKLATALEGIVTLPVLWWMAQQVIGNETAERRRLGSWIGVALAGLVAINSWHVMLSRMGLRIVLTPLTTALVIGFLARAMRHNRMRDYLALGAVLGAGTYLYQANRMLPILVVFGVGLVIVGGIRKPRDLVTLLLDGLGFAALTVAPLLILWYVAQVLEQSRFQRPREWGDALNQILPLLAMAWFSVLALIVRARRSDRLLQHGGGLLAAVVITFALYIPMYHYSQIYSDEFWNRTRGRLFGEEAFWKTDPETGEVIAYEPTLKEQVDRFWDKRDVFVDNYKKALRMYHWEGDGAWISNPHSAPALDNVAGGLLILGGLVWIIWAARRRDPVWWLLPAGVIVMLLPSAMTIAYVIENPSFTRGSGTIPPIFMLAALPLGVLLWQLDRLRWQVWRVSLGGLAGVVILGSLLGYGIRPDWDIFFDDYPTVYIYSWKPYHQIAQPLEEFAQGEGSYGNAFVVAYPHWLDHRILGAMAGDVRWPNGLSNRNELVSAIERNQRTVHEYDPAKPLMVMYHSDDMETEAYLSTLFPGGELLLYRYQVRIPNGGYTEGTFYIYKVWAGNIPVG